jgi:hypothetical protein
VGRCDHFASGIASFIIRIGIYQLPVIKRVQLAGLMGLPALTTGLTHINAPLINNTEKNNYFVALPTGTQPVLL